MHGGRSTGPRTVEGLARLTAAHTIHGCHGAEGRAFRAGVRNLLARHRLLQDLARLPGLGPNPDDLLRLFVQPIYPAAVPRRRRLPVAKPHAT